MARNPERPVPADTGDDYSDLPPVDSVEFELLARDYWAWSLRCCGNRETAGPDPLGGRPYPDSFYRWL